MYLKCIDDKCGIEWFFYPSKFKIVNGYPYIEWKTKILKQHSFKGLDVNMEGEDEGWSFD